MQFYIPAILALLAGSAAAQTPLTTCPFNGGRIPFGRYVCTGRAISQCAVTGQLVTIGACPNSCQYIQGIPYCF
ncbi:hypothetical protein EAF04_005518 [Stromatinia cepivora]|nr:hypothetical protein EAF04_005518 [Stromatinia cepivora]